MMKSGLILVTAFLLTATGCAAHKGGDMHSGQGMQHKHGMMHHGMMKRMDANADRVITKAEFMQAHEMMFDRMKNPDGVIDMSQMPMDGAHRMGGRNQMPAHTGKPAD
jgi:hypothetical protein